MPLGIRGLSFLSHRIKPGISLVERRSIGSYCIRYSSAIPTEGRSPQLRSIFVLTRIGFSGSPGQVSREFLSRSRRDKSIGGAYIEADRRTMLRKQVGTAGMEGKAELVSVSCNDRMISARNPEMDGGAHGYKEDDDAAGEPRVHSLAGQCNRRTDRGSGQILRVRTNSPQTRLIPPAQILTTWCRS